MKFKSLVLLSSLFISSFLYSDEYLVNQLYYYSSDDITVSSLNYSDISLESAFDFSVQFLAPRIATNTLAVSFVGMPSYICVSNLTTGVFYRFTDNPKYQTITLTLQSCIKYAYSHHMHDLLNWDIAASAGKFIYVKRFDPRSWLASFYSSLSPAELVQINLEILSSLQTINSDVSALVPSLDSHVATVSNLLSSLDRQFHEVTNLQIIANSHLYSIQGYTSDIYQMNQYASLIYDKVSQLIPSTASADTLALVFASAYGMEGYPYEAFVAAGLASDLYDAQNKASDQNWAHLNLPGAISAQIEKNALIQQFQRDGISPPAGTSFRNMGLQQLRNIASYSYNTPVSSNATLNAKSLEYLKHMNDTSDDINSGVQSLRDSLGGPLEVNVMNWPNDIFGSANLSNLFSDAIQGFQAAWTNFNPVYTWSDGTFFERSFYNWRGLNTLEFSGHGNPDQLEIGISSFAFSPTGNFFNDVPNLIALQGRVSMDVANMVGLVAAYTQTNLAAMSSTQSLENQYQEEFLQQATESLNEFSNALSSSNLLERNTHFIDTSSVFQTPAGFTEIFSGDHSIPSYINLQLPSWTFGQDDQSTPDTGSTITIETSQYATFFQNCRYVFLFLYWGITVMIMIWLFRLFSRFISWIPLSLTGGGSHDTVSI